MDTFSITGGKFWFICGFIVTGFILFSQSDAARATLEYSDPFKNVNLSPFEKMRNVYLCLLNSSSTCVDKKYQLAEDGWINVTQPETGDYCSGCAQHTQQVLMCVHLIKHDFKFANKATVQDLNETIISGCENGFTGVNLISGAMKISGSSLIFLTIPGLLLLAYFSI